VIGANERIKQTELGFKQEEQNLNLSDSLKQQENTMDAQTLEYPKLLRERDTTTWKKVILLW
jgi:hypothetical protein